MLVVAVAAVGFGAHFEAVRLAKLSRSYGRQAAFHARSIALYRGFVSLSRDSLEIHRNILTDFDQQLAQLTASQLKHDFAQLINDLLEMRPGLLEDLRYCSRQIGGNEKLVRYHERLFKKYTRLSRYPWLTAAPDSPEPPDPLDELPPNWRPSWMPKDR